MVNTGHYIVVKMLPKMWREFMKILKILYKVERTQEIMQTVMGESVLQMYKTTSLKGVEGNNADLCIFRKQYSP